MISRVYWWAHKDSNLRPTDWKKHRLTQKTAKNLIEGDQDAFLLGAGEADTFGGAFTIDETRTLIASGLDPDSLVAKGKRTKHAS